MGFFTKKETTATGNYKDFEYLPKDTLYFDSACQTLRPQQVIDSQQKYFQEFNACGGRVKYAWGQKVDQITSEARQKLLKMVKKSDKEYTVVFTLNTTYGINMVLHQLPEARFKQIITSEIEHNSVFLSTITWAKKNSKKRLVLERNETGELLYTKADLAQSIMLLNATSNIDGRELNNIKELANDAHLANGIVLIDAAQSFAHSIGLLQSADWDACFGSVHKMYGPSMGFIIIKKSLVKELDYFLLGGGTVTDVQKESFTLIADENEAFAPLEIGLQNWSGIVGLNAALDWLDTFKPEGKKPHDLERDLAGTLFNELKNIEHVTMLNTAPSAVVSLYSDKIDAHRLAIFLGEQNIMCRSGYFCCHYYLQHVKKYPPLLRVSLGLNNIEEQIRKLVEILTGILKNI